MVSDFTKLDILVILSQNIHIFCKSFIKLNFMSKKEDHFCNKIHDFLAK